MGCSTLAKVQENGAAPRVSGRRFTAAQKAQHPRGIQAHLYVRAGGDLPSGKYLFVPHFQSAQATADRQPLEAKRRRKADPQAADITQLRKKNVELERCRHSVFGVDRIVKPFTSSQ